MTIAEIFERHGEADFRDGERRVIAPAARRAAPRCSPPAAAPSCNAETRALIARARRSSVWLKADLDVLMRRVRRRANRPLLKTADPEGVMRRLIAERYPSMPRPTSPCCRATCRRTWWSSEIIAALAAHLASAPPRSRQPQRTAMTETSTPAAARRLRVDLAARAYDILIGPDLIDARRRRDRRAAARARALRASSPTTTVAAAHLPRLAAALDAAGSAGDARSSCRPAKAPRALRVLERVVRGAARRPASSAATSSSRSAAA